MKINKENKEEFIGQIIDLFEDLLDEKGIVLDNPERDAVADPEESANIYGVDYDFLHDQIQDILVNWTLLDTDDAR